MIEGLPHRAGGLLHQDSPQRRWTATPAWRWGKACLDVTPVPRVVKPPRQRVRANRYQLGIAELAGAAMSNTVTQYVKLGKMLPDMGPRRSRAC